MTKKMEQALNDTPIVNAILNHSVNEGESMGWFGFSGVEYKVNTLTALVKRGLLQFEYKQVATPRFIKRNQTHEKLYWIKQNEYWLTS